MNKTVLLSLLILLSASAHALDFFGIEHNGNTTDNVINLLYSLIQNDREQAAIYHAQLEQTDPDLAKDLQIEALNIPCYTCEGSGTLDSKGSCPRCEGSGQVSDAEALTYLQNKFCTAIDAGRSEQSAWSAAKRAFDERRELVLSRQTLFGTITRKESDGLLLSRQRSDDVVYLTHLNMMLSREGMPINGRVWPHGTYTYTSDTGEPVEVPCYTATLWAD